MIKIFKKNILDLSNTLPTFSITDSVATNTGSNFTNLMRNRNNTSGWMTTGSSDAGNTTIEVTFGDERTFDSILLVGMNFKSYTLKYWSNSAWADFSTAINETANSLSTKYHNFTAVSTTKLQLVIAGTQTADSEKYLQQFIVTEILGTFQVEPEIIPEIDKNRVVTRLLSAKSYVAKSVGAFNCTLKMKAVFNENDLSLVETMFDSFDGFLIWPCGGDTDQYETVRQGYRLEDIFFVDVANEYQPAWNDGRYKHGLPLNVKLVEVS